MEEGLGSQYDRKLALRPSSVQVRKRFESLVQEADEINRHMIEQGQGGAILFVASIAAHNVLYGTPLAPYSVSKAGVLHLTRCLAAEWARYGIRVNSISPGYMKTVMNGGNALEPTRKLCAERNPMGRMGEREELVGAVIFLCSRFAARYITGEDILVDGEFVSYFSRQGSLLTGTFVIGGGSIF